MPPISPAAMAKRERRLSTGARAGGRPNSLNLGRARLNPLLDRLDFSWDGRGGATGRRTFVRWPFRRETVELILVHPGGSRSSIRVACRNLSRGGASVLHSSYVHAGARCLVLLPRPGGSALSVEGRVVRCDHRAGLVHEIGVVFDREIDVRALIPHDPFMDFFSLESVDAGRLAGRVVSIGGDAVEQRWIAHLLRDSGVELRVAEIGREGLALVERGCDLVLCDLRLRDGTALDVVAALRAAGNGVPAVVLTASKDGALRRAVGDLRVDAFILKPPDRSMLLRALGEFLIVRRGERAGPARSEGTPDGVAAGMTEAAARLERAVLDGDAAGARAVCEQIGGAGRSGAFASARLLALEAASVLSATGDLRAAAAALRALARACRAAPARPRP